MTAIDVCPAHLVALAENMAERARDVVQPFWRTGTQVDHKADNSPVTQADRAIETALRGMIAAERPNDGIWGEEHGSERLDAEWVWVLDPIDGTRAFISGLPTFATLISLLHNGKPVLGLIDQPITGDRWLGAAGRTTLFNGQKAVTRRCRSLDKTHLKATSHEMFQGADAALFYRLTQAVQLTSYGGDALNYGLLAAGFLDLVVEASMHPHDFMALVPVVEGAGGLITDWSGNPLTMESDGRILAAADRTAHGAALAILGG
ncbi:MAG TPA: histidinol-phosphatase [Rhodospirillaceae bacterium]|nr:histidinol-phosphatase [Alphaproteobacteria bacterium]OUT39188.1 MAG: histidinol-phosphatase [Micavibrio sp. TMED2]HCI47419.1 histidinol-phosphatase [Rhodospirillaceae bacterium]MAS48535.1 histidinol-phosphatase [Alphaproteobacteria bacterium]MAX96207.1 histidinol-phosphatase [Alphaproteobacteria bacterium]|tara:strand:- start:7171 stop:7956 length:786 start_codon:yes stop_codon:yes gene_type:complete